MLCLSRNSRESRNGEVEFRRKKGCRMTDPLFLVSIIRCFGRPFLLFIFLVHRYVDLSQLLGYID